MMKNYGIPVASEGWPFIIPLAIVTALLFAFGWKNTASVSLVLTLFVLFFFRDPERTVPEGNGRRGVSCGRQGDRDQGHLSNRRT